MASYFFRTDHIPGVVVCDDREASIAYELAELRYGVAYWGGVMECSIAHNLKPWAFPVRLAFTGYRVGCGDWCDLPKDARLWGCRLMGLKPAEVVVFALLQNGLPMTTKGKSRSRAKS